jgi:hypothetical protein
MRLVWSNAGYAEQWHQWCMPKRNIATCLFWLPSVGVGMVLGSMDVPDSSNHDLSNLQFYDIFSKKSPIDDCVAAVLHNLRCFSTGGKGWFSHSPDSSTMICKKNCMWKHCGVVQCTNSGCSISTKFTTNSIMCSFVRFFCQPPVI